VKNYEVEHQKVDQYKKIMIAIIEQYSDSVKDKLLASMLTQRASVSDHIKEINLKISEIDKMVSGVNIVEQKLQ
jgi:bacterioferritin (cytochrome b1)